MPARVRRCAVVAGLMVVMLAALPSSAWAHGIGSIEGLSVLGFVPLGIEHMLLGWDHLLFIAGVVLLAGELGRAAKLISVFVAGHSTTLIIATMAGWQLDATLVDVVIAISVAFVGVVGFVGRPKQWTWFALAVLGFGLVHGLGLSTRLQALGLPENGLLIKVIAFNVGIEIGQLLAITVILLASRVLRKLITWPLASRVAHGGLIAAGLVAAVVLSIVTITGSGEAGAVGSCTASDTRRTVNGRGGHPAKDFFEPTETLPEDDFGHVVGDGYVVVRYPATLPTDQLTELRDYVTGQDGTRVVAGAVPGQTETLKATHAYQTITCAEFDLPALRTFTKNWFADPRSRPPE